MVEDLLSHSFDPRGVFLSAEVAANAQDFATAERLLTSIQSSHPQPAMVGYHLALVQYKAGRLEQCQKTLLDLIAVGHQTVDTYDLLVRCYHKQKKSNDAVEVFNHAIDQIPKQESVYLQLGRALLKSKLLPESHMIARRAVQIAPSESAYELKGMVELELQFYTDAIETYAKLNELNPNSAEGSLGMALAQWGARNDIRSAGKLRTGGEALPSRT